MREDVLRTLEIARDAIDNYIKLAEENATAMVGHDAEMDSYYQGLSSGAREARELMNIAFFEGDE